MPFIKRAGGDEEGRMKISVIEARDLSEAWFLCLRKTLTEGYEYKIERGAMSVSIGKSLTSPLSRSGTRGQDR